MEYGFFYLYNCYYEKKNNNNTPDKLENLPFDIPPTWSWCNAKSVLNIVVGATPSTSNNKYWDGDICWLPSGCCQDCDVTEDYPKRKYITKDGYESCSTTMMKPNTVLIALTGATAGKVGLLKFDACANQSVVGMSQYYGINPQFLFFQFMARRKEILADCIGSAQPHISKDYIEKMYIAVPPLQEQARIVEKIISCEPLLKDYESAESKLSLLEQEFPNKLKKSILQYAIEGKLVKQDPNDEPASVLLKRIKDEKEKLIKEGKIKRDKNESIIYQGDDKNYYEKIGNSNNKIIAPFKFPSNFCLARLKTICTKLVDGNHNPPKGEDYITSYLMLSSQNINNNSVINLGIARYLSKEQFQIENKRTNISDNDILFTSVGTLGRSCIYHGPLNICFQRSVSVVHSLLEPQYIKIYFDSPYFQNKVNRESTGTAQKGFYLNQLASSLIVVPPYRTMLKIIKKVNLINIQIDS